MNTNKHECVKALKCYNVETAWQADVVIRFNASTLQRFNGQK